MNKVSCLPAGQHQRVQKLGILRVGSTIPRELLLCARKNERHLLQKKSHDTFRKISQVLHLL